MEECNFGIRVNGHVKIRDRITRQILEEKDNAVHLGNLSAAIANALCSLDSGHIRYMAFGNGGTRITTTGQIEYRPPNVSNIRRSTDSLYNETFKKEILNIAGNSTTPILSNSTYTDIQIIVTLDTVENGLNQLAIDRASAMTVEENGDFSNVGTNDAVFDEIALYAGIPGISGKLVDSNDALMLTHVIFHPTQKSANRDLEIEYTLRIQLT